MADVNNKGMTLALSQGVSSVISSLSEIAAGVSHLLGPANEETSRTFPAVSDTTFTEVNEPNPALAPLIAAGHSIFTHFTQSVPVLNQLVSSEDPSNSWVLLHGGILQSAVKYAGAQDDDEVEAPLLVASVLSAGMLVLNLHQRQFIDQLLEPFDRTLAHYTQASSAEQRVQAAEELMSFIQERLGEPSGRVSIYYQLTAGDVGSEVPEAFRNYVRSTNSEISFSEAELVSIYQTFYRDLLNKPNFLQALAYDGGGRSWLVNFSMFVERHDKNIEPDQIFPIQSRLGRLVLDATLRHMSDHVPDFREAQLFAIANGNRYKMSFPSAQQIQDYYRADRSLQVAIDISFEAELREIVTQINRENSISPETARRYLRIFLLGGDADFISMESLRNVLSALGYAGSAQAYYDNANPLVNPADYQKNREAFIDALKAAGEKAGLSAQEISQGVEKVTKPFLDWVDLVRRLNSRFLAERTGENFFRYLASISKSNPYVWQTGFGAGHYLADVMDIPPESHNFSPGSESYAAICQRYAVEPIHPALVPEAAKAWIRGYRNLEAIMEISRLHPDEKDLPSIRKRLAKSLGGEETVIRILDDSLQDPVAFWGTWFDERVNKALDGVEVHRLYQAMIPNFQIKEYLKNKDDVRANFRSDFIQFGEKLTAVHLATSLQDLEANMTNNPKAWIVRLSQLTGIAESELTESLVNSYDSFIIEIKAALQARGRPEHLRVSIEAMLNNSKESYALASLIDFAGSSWVLEAAGFAKKRTNPELFFHRLAVYDSGELSGERYQAARKRLIQCFASLKLNEADLSYLDSAGIQRMIPQANSVALQSYAESQASRLPTIAGDSIAASDPFVISFARTRTAARVALRAGR